MEKTKAEKYPSIRLNQALRDEICQSVMTEWDIGNPSPDLKHYEDEAAQYFYNLSHGKVDFSAVPVEYLSLSQEVKVAAPGIGHGMFCFELKKGLPNKSCNSYNRPVDYAVQTKADSKVIEKYLKLKDEHDKIYIERNKFRGEVWAVVEQATTTRQLLEAWPNIEKFIPAHLLDPNRAVKLPSLPISRLDEALGLNK